MRADWVPGEVMERLLGAMMPANALALRCSMATGLRIGDVLAITRKQCAQGRFTVSEEKTGKHRRVYLPKKLAAQMFAQAGRFFVFEHRLDEKSTAQGRRCIKTCAGWRCCTGLTAKNSRPCVAAHGPENLGGGGIQGREECAAALES